MGPILEINCDACGQSFGYDELQPSGVWVYVEDFTCTPPLRFAEAKACPLCLDPSNLAPKELTDGQD